MVGHEMTLDEAVDLVAREVFARGDERSWEHYPEIGEHDWDRVLTRVAELMPVTDVAEFDAAYAFLTARAEADTDARCEPTPNLSCE